MAQNVFLTDAWTRARNRFVEDLTDEEQVCTCYDGLSHFTLAVMGKSLSTETHFSFASIEESGPKPCTQSCKSYWPTARTSRSSRAGTLFVLKCPPLLFLTTKG